MQPYYRTCLIRGQGVDKDMKKGCALIQNSVDFHNGSGWLVQGECNRYGYGVTRNNEKAAESYLGACSAHSVFDKFELITHWDASTKWGKG